MFNLKEMEKAFVDRMVLNAPMKCLYEAKNNPGMCFNTGLSHNDRSILLCYENDIKNSTAVVSGAVNMIMDDGRRTYCIFVDKHFIALDGDTQKNLIWHEIGHIEKGHLDGPQWKVTLNNITRIFGFSFLEWDADKFAASKTSNVEVAAALLNVSRLVKCNQLDIKSRINRLRRKEVA